MTKNGHWGCKSTPSFLTSFFLTHLMREFTSSALPVGFPSLLVTLHTSRFGMKYELLFVHPKLGSHLQLAPSSRTSSYSGNSTHHLESPQSTCMNMIMRILPAAQFLMSNINVARIHLFFVRVLVSTMICMLVLLNQYKCTTNVLQMYKGVPLEKCCICSTYMMHVIFPRLQQTLQFPNHWYKYDYCLELICPTQMHRNCHVLPEWLGMVPLRTKSIFPWNPTRGVQHRLYFRSNTTVPGSTWHFTFEQQFTRGSRPWQPVHMTFSKDWSSLQYQLPGTCLLVLEYSENS